MRTPRPQGFAFYWGTGIADDVPALTYYLVLSLAPVALGLAALEALLLSNTQAAINVADGLNRFLPDAAHARHPPSRARHARQLAGAAGHRAGHDAVDDVGRHRRHRALRVAHPRLRRATTSSPGACATWRWGRASRSWSSRRAPARRSSATWPTR